MKLASLYGATAVAAGAFGAHGLGDHPRLDVWETAALYHLAHAVVLAIPAVPRASRLCFAAGVAIFSGSLYLLVLLDAPWLGAVTPIGGLTMILGWLLLARGRA